MLRHISNHRLWRQHGGKLRHPAVIAVLYTLFFGACLWQMQRGAGQYWDWAFPFFRDQMGAFFGNNSQAWNGASMGGPLGYSTDYFMRWFISLGGFIQPETWHYVLYTLTFGLGATGVYQLVRQHARTSVAVMAGLVAYINPTIFYKYTAGHFNYLVAYAVFGYFLYFLFYRAQRNYASAVWVGLLVTLMGVQIQFFIIAGLFVGIFVLFYRRVFSWRQLVVMGAVPVLISLVWLVNFATGANNAAEISGSAAKVSFKGATASDFLSIFSLQFSKATLLSRYYSLLELVVSGLPFVLLFALLRRRRPNELLDVVLLVFLVLLLFMATGLFQQVNLGPLTMFYPMLREVGHFAALIVLLVLLLVTRFVDGVRWQRVFLGLSMLVLLISLAKFQQFPQAIPFAHVRQRLAPYKAVADRDPGTYRVLSYPFFDMYRFTDLPFRQQEGFPLTNTGHDSFATYSRQDFIRNQIPPHQFDNSLQNRLLETYDIDVLRPYNVKYIFDYSPFMESNYNNYVPRATYHNDIRLVKNDPQFLDKLLAHNPGRLRRVNSRVLEVTDYSPRVVALTNVFDVPKSEQARGASQFTRSTLSLPFDYTVNERMLGGKTASLFKLFADINDFSFDAPSKTFQQTFSITNTTPSTLYANNHYQKLYYDARGGKLSLYSMPAGGMQVDGKAVAQTGKQRTLWTVPLADGQQYFIAFHGETTPVQAGGDGVLGEGKPGDTLVLLSSNGPNQLGNGSFEQGMWRATVDDCNDYDSDGSIGMRLSTGQRSHGTQSLELSATRHDACTHADLSVQSGTEYALSIDYQSDSAQTASFFLSYNKQQSDASSARGFRAITDRKWHTLTRVIATPKDARSAQLFLYARESDGQTAAVNHYDNISLVPLRREASLTLPKDEAAFTATKLGTGGKHTVTLLDDAHDYGNLISNPSFEDGPWRKNVNDCNNMDPRPNIGMRLNRQHKTAGAQSLELTARHHDACTFTAVNVSPGGEYVLSFDYQGEGAKQYGYAVTFDDPGDMNTKEQFDLKPDGKWHQYRATLKVPPTATTMTLYLYAFESDGKAANTVRYDNLRLVELPDLSNRFYVASEAPQRLVKPRDVELSAHTSTHNRIQVRGATTPFVLGLSETYHPKWRLAAGGTAVRDHFAVDEYMNGWYVDPTALCARPSSACQRNSDGSYDVQLVADFTPQRWFVVARAISGLTIIGGLGMVAAGQARRYRGRRRAI